jgi:hypothetical protein
LGWALGIESVAIGSGWGAGAASALGTATSNWQAIVVLKNHLEIDFISITFFSVYDETRLIDWSQDTTATCEHNNNGAGRA